MISIIRVFGLGTDLTPYVSAFAQIFPRAIAVVKNGIQIGNIEYAVGVAVKPMSGLKKIGGFGIRLYGFLVFVQIAINAGYGIAQACLGEGVVCFRAHVQRFLVGNHG